ncbi:hypothetical protein L227DRAFT_649777 [Lentinus tigrinus ALCF2SS1-6]|uniref:Uncharacterized protein n=1 Tax=Lentinus tigrinus ALCF2SS1-6 TaxID=1328759 RepID=A0A5C2SL31_9APHY|nr:hypothetical protein L227DRAFT_649777 [Lentinus tigrinus ALCF2SS1-6]
MKRFTNAYMLVYVREPAIDEVLAPWKDEDTPAHLKLGKAVGARVTQLQQNQVRAMKRFTNAYMLVYVREPAIDEVLAPWKDEDTPAHLKLGKAVGARVTQPGRDVRVGGVVAGGPASPEDHSVAAATNGDATTVFCSQKRTQDDVETRVMSSASIATVDGSETAQEAGRAARNRKKDEFCVSPWKGCETMKQDSSEVGRGLESRRGISSVHVLGRCAAAYANLAMQEADFIIALGARFASDGRDRGGIIHFEIQPKNINEVVSLRRLSPVIGDVVANMAVLAPLINLKPSPREEWFKDIREGKSKYPFTSAEEQSWRVRESRRQDGWLTGPPPRPPRLTWGTARCTASLRQRSLDLGRASAGGSGDAAAEWSTCGTSTGADTEEEEHESGEDDSDETSPGHRP